MEFQVNYSKMFKIKDKEKILKIGRKKKLYYF